MWRRLFSLSSRICVQLPAQRAVDLVDAQVASDALRRLVQQRLRDAGDHNDELEAVIPRQCHHGRERKGLAALDIADDEPGLAPLLRARIDRLRQDRSRRLEQRLARLGALVG